MAGCRRRERDDLDTRPSECDKVCSSQAAEMYKPDQGRTVTELSTHVFELNLTSVCVSSGVIQLPLKMIEYFAPGSVAAELDGEAVELAFQAPRRLYGLRDHFGARGLRSNDRVRFALEVDAGRLVRLSATCVKRERQRPNEETGAEQGRAERKSSSYDLAPREPWESVEEVRAVRRVRIPGLPSAQAPSELDVPARDANPDWEDDRRGPAASWADAATGSIPDEGLTTVRVKRRPAAQHGASASVGAGASPAPAVVDHAEQVVGPITATMETEVPLQLSDLRAPPIESARPVDTPADSGWRPRNWAALSSRMRLGARPAAPQPRDRPYTSGPSRSDRAAGQPQEERTGSREQGRELVAAPLRAGGADTTVGAPRPVVLTGDRPQAPSAEVGRVPPGEPAGEAGGHRTPSAGGHEGYVRSQRVEPAAAGSRLLDKNGRGSTDPRLESRARGETGRSSDQAGNEPGTLFPAPQVARATASRASSPNGPRAADTHSTVARVEQRNVPLIDDADFGGEYLVTVDTEPEAAAPASGGLELDIRSVEEYLSRPDTPAIIRAEALGEILGMGEERAERALERISERPDRLSRIRRGAYMVRARRD